MGSRANKLILIGIVVGAIAGVLCGMIFGTSMSSISFMGDIFKNALKMMIVPLIITSMISGITSIGDIRKLGSIGWKTLLYYLTTTFIAVLLGIILVNIIQPGKTYSKHNIVKKEQLKNPDKVEQNKDQSVSGVLVQVVTGIFSPNIFKSMVELDVLPIIFFSLLFGIVLTIIGSRAGPVIHLFDILNEGIMKMIGIILWISPLGVFALTAHQFGKDGGLFDVYNSASSYVTATGVQELSFWQAFSEAGFIKQFAQVAAYAMTVIIGLLIHGVIILPLILSIVARRNPWAFVKGMGTALSTAFSTSSSSGTLPVTLECIEDNNKISNETASFVLPLGATINMDGTALYEAIAVMFIAQALNIELTIAQQFIIFLTATLAAVGAAGIPSAGLITMILVLKAVNLPTEGIALIIAIDWFLDRCRTTVNVWGDAVCAAVIDSTLEKKELPAT